MSTRLKAPDGGEYVRWLHDSLNPAALRVVDEEVIRAIAALGTPLLTTN
jgi:hypothetical protein